VGIHNGVLMNVFNVFNMNVENAYAFIEDTFVLFSTA